MPHIITQNCCNDATCVPVCPVNCIHPTPDEPGYRTAEMLYIDPEACIDCGACVDACPVSAIVADDDLPEELSQYEALNAHYYEAPGRREYGSAPSRKTLRSFDGAPDETLRVAVVGAGPAGMYAAGALLGQRGAHAEVDVFERLATPGGLVRYGVAPDHQETKAIGDHFNAIMSRKGFRLYAGVSVGEGISHTQLTQRYHAVLYAVGAMRDRNLGIPGEDLPGSRSATEMVGWYNGHPDFFDQDFDFSDITEGRVVILGNGNVALDVARVLTSDPDKIARTDISDRAVAALRASNVSEVVVVGRRGTAQAAFTSPELLGLASVDRVQVTVKEAEIATSRGAGTPPSHSMSGYKQILLDGIADRTSTRNQADERSLKTVVLRFLSSPVEILGDSDNGVTGVRLVHNELVEEVGPDGGPAVIARPTGETEVITTSLVLRSVGYRGSPLEGLPFDTDHATFPNHEGRVLDPTTGEPLSQTYVAGWIKRGPSGVIGTNKVCAEETVAKLLDDFVAGRLPRPTVADDLDEILPDTVNVAGWRAIDADEKQSGRAVQRPRVKFYDMAAARRVAADKS
jgi:ferredoxin--NADP+ reductase